MKRLIGFGLFSLLGLSSLACGDDKKDNDDPPSDNAGSGGGENTAGDAGVGGMEDDTAPPVVVTTTPAVDDFVGIATCTGCVEVSVPVSGGNSDANVLDQVGFPFYLNPTLDLSNAVVTWRVMALENNADLMVAPYAENNDPYPGAYRLQAALSAANFPPGEWVDVAFDLSAHPALGGGAAAGIVGDAGVLDAGVTITVVADASAPAAPDAAVATLDGGVVDTDAGAVAGDAGSADAPAPSGDLSAAFQQPLNPAFDKSAVAQLGLYVGSGPNLVGDAVVKVAIDSVRFTGVPGRADVTFENGLEGFTRNNYNEPPGSQGPLLHP